MIVTIDNPPVNALGAEVRQGLWDAIGAAEDPGVKAVVIHAAGRTFPAGADIREFGKPPADPWLPDLCNRIEACDKLVVAALHGTALGGGFEVALACHTRIALASAKVGFPEVNLGILPGAGGTQRAPRLCGAQEALTLMIEGKPIDAPTAMAMGLIDGVVEEDLLEQAILLAGMLVEEGKPLRRSGECRDGFRDPIGYEAAIRAARAVKRDPNLPAPGRIIDCVEAALLLPFENGLGYERAAFEDLVASEASAGLRHAFLSERRAGHIPEAHATPREIAQAGVVGGGLMGAGIATALLGAGLHVTLVEADRERLAAGLGRIDDLHERAVKRGRLSADAREAEWDRLGGTTDLAGLGAADLVIEAVTEDEALKAGVFRDLDRVMKPGAVLATNTSYLDVDDLARVTDRPADVVGLHFFSPVQAMRLVEVVAAAKTAPEVVATGFALAKRLGKVAVRAGVCDGFIGNRMLTAYRMAADILLEEGAAPAEVDAAMRDFGFAMGPYQVADMAGLDISWARRKRLADSRDPAQRYVAIADRLCEAGRFGQKTGAGYYRYAEGSRTPEEDPAVADILQAERSARGIEPRRFGKVEIRQRCLFAMVNEGAKILAEGIALRPSDIDVVMLAGYGFPRWRGGPMKAADRLGILQVRNALRGWAADEPFWTPAPMLNDMIKNGRHFDDMNAEEAQKS